jgi:tRNA/tmRNA/rRNA uracil-C5-methylase (TrmA/RlmC/RlmD family)
MSNYPNQHARNQWHRIEARQAAIKATRANARARRIDNALFIAGSILAVAALILAIMGI